MAPILTQIPKMYTTFFFFSKKVDVLMPFTPLLSQLSNYINNPDYPPIYDILKNLLPPICK